MKKSILVISSIVLAIALFCTTVFGATYKRTDLEMVEIKDDKCEDQFGEYGEFTKQMTNLDTKNKTIDLELTVKNNAREQQEEVTSPADVVFLIDNSDSMAQRRYNSHGDEISPRREYVINAAKELASKLKTSEYDIQFGIVEFATYKDGNVYSPYADTPNTDYSKDAITLTENFTSDLTTINNALDQLYEDSFSTREHTENPNRKLAPQTNIAAGLKQAQDLFTNKSRSNAVKHLIILTDGLPYYSAPDYDTVVSTSAHYAKCVQPAIDELNAIKSAGNINVESVLINFGTDNFLDQKMLNSPESEYDTIPKDEYTYEYVSDKIFGVPFSPRVGTINYVDDENLSTFITENIYDTLISSVSSSSYKLSNIVIKDYFPQYIIDNFDFEIIEKENIGTVTASIDKSTRCITWTIDELAPQTTGKVKYRLTLKETVQDSAVNVNLDTNEKIEINYDENDEPGEPVIDDKTPTVKLIPPTPENNTPANKPQDNTTANKTIPQTGTKATTSILSIGLISCISLLGIVSFTEYKNIKIK